MEQQRDKTALDEYTKQHDLEQKEKERQRLIDSARYLEVRDRGERKGGRESG